MKHAIEIGAVATMYMFKKEWFRHAEFDKGGYTDRMKIG